MWQKLRLLVLILCGGCINFSELTGNSTLIEIGPLPEHRIGFLEGHPGSWVYSGTEMQNIYIEKNGGILNFKIVKLKDEKYLHLDKNTRVSIWVSKTEWEDAQKSQLSVERIKRAFEVGSGVRIDISEAVHTFFGGHNTEVNSFYIFVVVGYSNPYSIGSFNSLTVPPNTQVFRTHVTITN